MRRVLWCIAAALMLAAGCSTSDSAQPAKSQTQNNLFKNHCKVGIGPESNDLSFPDYKKIAFAFDIPYFSAHSNEEMHKAFADAMSQEGFAICEIFVSTEQIFEPKSSTKRLEDGTLVSPPLEDLAPFLPREELMKNIYIKPIE